MSQLLTTMAGSLPFKSIDEAVEYALMHDIPAVPELPKLDGSMFAYARHPGKIASYGRFCETARERGVKNVKIQCVGPYTAMYGEGFSENDAVDGISKHINFLLRGLDFADTVYLCLDEPRIGRDNLTLDPADAGYNRIQGVFIRILPPRNLRIIKMLHSCNDFSDRLGYFDDLGFKVVSFDATKYNLKCAGGSLRAEYQKFREKGGVLCFGAVSIMDGFGVSQFSPSDARDGDMISHSCGFGNLSVDDCYRGRRILQDIKDGLR